jgi:hypothetical protein
MKLSTLLAWSFADGFWVARYAGMEQSKARQLPGLSTCCALERYLSSCKQLYCHGTTVLNCILIHTHEVKLSNNSYVLESSEHISASSVLAPSCWPEMLLSTVQGSCRVTLTSSMTLLNQTWCMRWDALYFKMCWRSSAIYILYSLLWQCNVICPNMISLIYEPMMAPQCGYADWMLLQRQACW